MVIANKVFKKKRTGFLLVALLFPGLVQAQAEGLSFNRDIRPILSDNCFYCHGQDGNKRKADLRLDLRETAVNAGAIVPGNLLQSELIRRIESKDPDERMPPPDSNRVLGDDDKKTLRRWVESGASYETHWAFDPPARSPEPMVHDASWPRNPIDFFVLAKLESLGAEPSPEATRETLIKRLSIDLTGLPPTPEEVLSFVSNEDPAAYEQLVDRLINSRHYGERMALPWLDAARYADSNGFQQDGDTWQWIWRDWVVEALNDDLPFDQFTVWQLAGDLLPSPTLSQKIASGFNRNHLLNGEGGAIPEEQRFVILFDRMDTTATTWLGLTMACAQCHDHKYDPITQRDYYALMDAFNRVPERGTPQRQSTRIRVAEPFIELPTAENKARIAAFERRIRLMESEVQPANDRAFQQWRSHLASDQKAREQAALPDELKAGFKRDDAEETSRSKWLEGLRRHFERNVLPQQEEGKVDREALSALRKTLAEYQGDQIPRAMVMSDAKPRQTHILNRGAYLSPMEAVSFATPAFLPPMPTGAPANRLGLAQWLVSDDHPLTARVQVNRMWQHFFGMGIVKTAEDFGVQSEYPVHRDLLDWLAVEFRDRGWSQKQLHSLIVTSATYRQASRLGDWHRQEDIENRYYARASRFRMPAMLLRDWALESAGLLVREIGGAPVYPYQPANVWEALAITKERDFTYPASSGGSLYRRSLYTFWRRTVGPVNMFDVSNRQACRVRQSVTSTPLHALTTLNDPTWVEAARALADRCRSEEERVENQIRMAFQRVLSRKPTPKEIGRLLRAFERQVNHYEKNQIAAEALLAWPAPVGPNGSDPSLRAALATVCLGIFNLDEALTRE